MENQERLPRGYEKRFVIDPRKNRKQALAVWGVSLLIALVLFGVAQAIWQGQSLLLFTHRVTFYVTWVILIFGFLIYAVLHEVIRGLCVRLVTGRRPQHYDNTLPGVYMNSASPVFLSKRAFAAIALAIATRCCSPPLIIFGYWPRIFSGRPTSSRHSAACPLASARESPCSSSGYITFSTAVRRGNKWNA